MFDAGPVNGEFSDNRGDRFFACLIAVCDVDVEALCADHLTGIVMESFTDDDDFSGGPLHRDNAVAGAERSVALADVVECRRDVLVVVWVLVREHQWCRWGDCSGLVAVDLFHLGRPFPRSSEK